MLTPRRPWQEELGIVDRAMKAISDISDPDLFVKTYFDSIGELMPLHDYLSLSRRNIEPPDFLITRSSRFTEHLNPWSQRDRLPRLSGGLAGELAYSNGPVIIDDLPSRLAPDDPAYFYLQGFQSLISLPHYDRREALNVTLMLLPPGIEIERSMIPIMHWQGGLFGRGTQNLVLRNELSTALGALDREMQAVGDIQRSLLPSSLPPIPGFELAAYYRTSARAGGDYYDFFPLEGGLWGIFIADVSGHGTPAAVLMAITHALAHSHPNTHTPPALLLTYLNNRLTRAYTQGGTFITAFYAVLDPATRSLTYSTAGHNPPRLVRRSEVLSLNGSSNGLPLGILPDQSYSEDTLTLQRHDLLLLYTDGITEAMAPLNGGTSRHLFGVERLDHLLLDCSPIRAEDCISRIQSELATFSHNALPTDDQTLIAMRAL